MDYDGNIVVGAASSLSDTHKASVRCVQVNFHGPPEITIHGETRPGH